MSSVVKIPPNVAAKGHVAVYNFVKKEIPAATFNKASAKGKKWEADFCDCALSQDDIQTFVHSFKPKPWLKLIFPSPSTHMEDRLKPIKEENTKESKENSKAVPSIDGASPGLTVDCTIIEDTPQMLLKKPEAMTVFHSNVEGYIKCIEKELKRFEEAVVVNSVGIKMTETEMRAEDLLFALKQLGKSVKQTLSPEVIEAMNALALSLRVNDKPLDNTVAKDGTNDSDDTSVDGSRSLLGDDSSSKAGDGKVIIDDELEDEFVETQPWDI